MLPALVVASSSDTVTLTNTSKVHCLLIFALIDLFLSKTLG